MAVTAPPGLAARSAGMNAAHGLGAAPKPPRPPQTRAPKVGQAPGPNDPYGLQPLSGAQITNQIAGYVNQMPAPLTETQIRQRAQSLLDPIVQQLQSHYADLTKSGAGAISGYANQLAQNLAGEQGNAARIYGGAAQSQAATDAALASAQQGGGLDEANKLAATLASIGANQPNVNAATAGQVGAAATGSAGALLGTGSASLSQLLAEGAAAQDYAGKLPGLARSQGLSDINNLSLSNQKAAGDATLQLEQQLPGLVQQYESRNDTISGNRASAAQQLFEYLTSRNTDLSKFQQAEQLSGLNATTKAAATVQSAQIRAQTAREAAQAKAAQTSFDNQLKFAKTYGYDPVTNTPLPGYARNAQGKIVKVSTSAPGGKASAKGQLTDAQAARMVQLWHDGKPTSVTTPVIDPKTGKQTVNPTTGKPITTSTTAVTSQLKYGQAYAMLRQFGKNDKQARALLDTVYAKGDNGRAWITNEEQAALKTAGVTAQPKVTKNKNGKTVALLGPRQYQALKNAKLLPPGQLTQEGWYVISGGY